jgi:uncharacterized membrane protein YccC
LTFQGPRAHGAFKAIVSVLLAVAVATALRLDDLSWAAFSGYMVMRGDAQQTIPRGVHRVVGTVAGASLGLLLVAATADSPLLLMFALFLVSWIGVLGALTSRYSYAWLFVGITAGLVLTDGLSSPTTIWHFALTRVAEIAVGTCSCLLVACLFETGRRANADASSSGTPAPSHTRLRELCSERGLREHWPLIVHATRTAVAVSALPLVWRWFGIRNFSQTALTTFVLMIVPAMAVQERKYHAVYARTVHRVLGCLLGSVAAIACIGFGDGILTEGLALSAAIWIGHHIQTGREGINYLGTQFVLAFLVTLIQGPGPDTSILPGLERLLGVVIGSAMLCLLLLIWPPAHDA